MSKSVLSLLENEGITISGFPWSEGEKIVGLNALVGKCLCADHNSMLSPLDDAAYWFFFSLLTCFRETKTRPKYFIVSGHDVERWLVKTLVGFAATNNLVVRGERVGSGPGAYEFASEFIAYWDRWPKASGLYLMQKVGSTVRHARHFELVPLFDIEGKIAGLQSNILGLEFACIMRVPIASALEDLNDRGYYRPGQLGISVAGNTSILELCWQDGIQHGFVEMTFPADYA